jgi:hypothetical protein
MRIIPNNMEISSVCTQKAISQERDTAAPVIMMAKGGRNPDLRFLREIRDILVGRLIAETKNYLAGQFFLSVALS